VYALTFVPVYAVGSGEHGQLGNGKTGEHIVSAGKTAFDVKDSPGIHLFEFTLGGSNHRSTSVPVRGMEGKKIVQIATGSQHAMALADSG
jgi:alpha-tubulin suppressor-like RCC1 family protein